MNPPILLLVSGVGCLVFFAVLLGDNAFSANFHRLYGKWVLPLKVAFISIGVLSLLIFGFQLWGKSGGAVPPPAMPGLPTSPNLLLPFIGAGCFVAFALLMNNSVSANFQRLHGKWVLPLKVAFVSVGALSLLIFGFQLVHAGWV